MLLQVKLHYGKRLDIHCEYLDSLQCDQTGRVAWMLQCAWMNHRRWASNIHIESIYYVLD